MSEHVGHLVEVTGTIIDEAAPKPDGAPAELSNPQSPPAQNPPTSAAPVQTERPKAEHTINVRTIRMIGENCSPKN
jgi:hypothetical protein